MKRAHSCTSKLANEKKEHLATIGPNISKKTRRQMDPPEGEVDIMLGNEQMWRCVLRGEGSIRIQKVTAPNHETTCVHVKVVH